MLEEKGECDLDIDLLSIKLGTVHDIPLVEDWSVLLDVEEIETHLATIHVHLRYMSIVHRIDNVFGFYLSFLLSLEF